MPDRVTKERSKSKKTLERKTLSIATELFGVTADMPCTYCFQNRLRCVMNADERSKKCAECIRRGRPCDGQLVASSRNYFLVFPFYYLPADLLS